MDERNKGGRRERKRQGTSWGEGRTQMRTEMEKEKTVMDCRMRREANEQDRGE